MSLHPNLLLWFNGRLFFLRRSKKITWPRDLVPETRPFQEMLRGFDSDKSTNKQLIIKITRLSDPSAVSFNAFFDV